MSGWNIANWHMPVFFRVILITLAIMAGIVGTIGAIVAALMWVHSMWGENVTAAVFFGSLFFAIISWLVWMTIEDKW